MNLTSNQFYGGLNRRFDRRISFLIRFGFRHVMNEWGAFMVRKGPGVKDVVIPTGVILFSDNRVWRDKLAFSLRRFGSMMVGYPVPLSC